MMRRALVVLLLLRNVVQNNCRHVSAVSTRIAFAGGGFGGGGGFGSKTKAGTKNKNKKKRVLVDLQNEEEPKQSTTGTTTATAKQALDKWGLPVVPTEEEMFPPMPPGTELISALPENQVTLETFQQALVHHMQINLDCFDENGIEKQKNPSSGRDPMKLKLLHVSPPVLEIENFFTSEECEATRQLVQGPDDKDLMEIGSATFSPLATSKRTSTTWFCHYAKVPTLLAKAMHVFGFNLVQSEEPQIVRYKTGQEFSWHYDEVPAPQLDNGGQRIATLLVYLNTVNEGGGTVFRDLMNDDGKQLTVQPRQGCALVFFPATADGIPDDRTLHKGQVVEAKDSKWIAQMWIHQSSYQPVVPKGNSHEAAQVAIQEERQRLGYD